MSVNSRLCKDNGKVECYAWRMVLKENTALNIQKPLEILVTDEDKHGTDIACMSDFFGIYIENFQQN